MRNVYDGEFVDMKKVEDEAYKRAQSRDEKTYIHYHKFSDNCDGSVKKHKMVERKEDNASEA